MRREVEDVSVATQVGQQQEAMKQPSMNTGENDFSGGDWWPFYVVVLLCLGGLGLAFVIYRHARHKKRNM